MVFTGSDAMPIVSGKLTSETAYAYNGKGLTYSNYDCIHFVNLVRETCGLNVLSQSTNRVWRSSSALTWKGTIQEAYQKFDGIVINPAAYTHTSVALLDALKAVSIPTVEVHISKVDERESFRQLSYVSYYASRTIIGKGFEGYLEAIDFLADGGN